MVSILSTKEFGRNSFRFCGKPFFPQMGAGPLKKGAMTPLSRKKGVPAKKIYQNVPTKFSFDIGTVNTKKILTNTDQNYRIDVKL